MKVFILLAYLFATIYAASLANLLQKTDESVERQLFNRNAHVVLQEPIEAAQERADRHAAKVKRGDYQPPHHPKYRPTGTHIPALQTHAWDDLALLKKRMEQDSLLEKRAAHEARQQAKPTGFETVAR